MKQRSRSMLNGDDLMNEMTSSKKCDDDLNHSEIQLHKIRSQEHYIEAQVQEGDTLQAIALRFYCTISELKRINHIHKDNEIFARRTIKVPVTPYSVLTELIPSTVQKEPMPSTSNNSITNLFENDQESNSHQIIQQRSPISNRATDSLGDSTLIDCNAVVLNSTLAPSVIPYSDIEPCESVTEDTQLLPNKEKVSVETVVVKELTSHGADFGLKWFHLLCLVLSLGVIAPIVYVLFILDSPKHSDVKP